jgi:hypothetical protein
MAKEYPPEELASRTFVITIVGAALFIAAVFLFIL